jgi:hypothetical protein
MKRLINLALALSATGIAVLGFQAVPAHAATSPSQQSAIVGELGYEGGAVAPGGFHPTAGTVQVQFSSVPLTLEKHVGKSGHFDVKLSPGKYTVIGCGPASSSASTGSSRCSKPKKIDLVKGEVDHFKLIWAYVP